VTTQVLAPPPRKSVLQTRTVPACVGTVQQQASTAFPDAAGEVLSFASQRNAPPAPNRSFDEINSRIRAHFRRSQPSSGPTSINNRDSTYSRNRRRADEAHAPASAPAGRSPSRRAAETLPAGCSRGNPPDEAFAESLGTLHEKNLGQREQLLAVNTQSVDQRNLLESGRIAFNYRKAIRPWRKHLQYDEVVTKKSANPRSKPSGRGLSEHTSIFSRKLPAGKSRPVFRPANWSTPSRSFVCALSESNR